MIGGKSGNFLKKIMGAQLQRTLDESLVDSIRENMILLLNTRQGMTPHIPDFGLPDIHMVYHSLPKSLDDLGQEIKRVLETYEKRLSNIQVRLKENAADIFRATYQITGELREGGRISKLTFQTHVYRNGSADAQLVQ